MFRSLLAPLDGSEVAEQPLPYAMRIAQAAGARVVLLHARWDLAQAVRPAIDLDRMSEGLRARGVAVEARLYSMPREEDAAAVIIDAAHELQSDLIVMTTHGRGGVSRLFHGSVADQVMRRTDLPLLLVPARSDRTWPTDRRLRVLVPLDGSERAEAVLPPAAGLMQILGGDLYLLGVVDFATYADVERYVPGTFQRGLSEARQYLGQVADRLSPGASAVGIEAAIGEPVSTIAKVAQQRDVDLIALASHGRGGVVRVVLGSVATGLLQTTIVPLLLVRSPDLAGSDGSERR